MSYPGCERYCFDGGSNLSFMFSGTGEKEIKEKLFNLCIENSHMYYDLELSFHEDGLCVSLCDEDFKVNEDDYPFLPVFPDYFINMFYFFNTVFSDIKITAYLSFMDKHYGTISYDYMFDPVLMNCTLSVDEPDFDLNPHIYSCVIPVESISIKKRKQYFETIIANAQKIKDSDIIDYLTEKYNSIFSTQTFCWAAFYGSKKKSAVVPKRVTSIDNNACCKCESLEKITMHDNVVSIGDYAFYNCINLSSLYVSKNLKVIGTSAFKGCKKLADKNKYVIVNNILFDYTGRKKEIVIPENVTKIEKDAFRDCKSIISVTIPKSVTSISDYAFYGCINLKSVTLPDSLTDISDTAFLGTALKKMPAFGYVIDGSKCNWNNVNPEDLEKMLKNKNYSVRMDHPTKYQFVAQGFLKDNQSEAEEYIKKNIAKILPFFIDIDDYETVKALLESGKFVTKRNIMNFIDHAVEHTQNGGDMQIQVLLMNYKNDNFQDMDPMKGIKF